MGDTRITKVAEVRFLGFWPHSTAGGGFQPPLQFAALLKTCNSYLHPRMTQKGVLAK
jgi:hypothetical protein